MTIYLNKVLLRYIGISSDDKSMMRPKDVSLREDLACVNEPPHLCINDVN